jgi:hypothetical protein
MTDQECSITPMLKPFAIHVIVENTEQKSSGSLMKNRIPSLSDRQGALNNREVGFGHGVCFHQHATHQSYV